MQKRLIISSTLLNITIERLCRQVIENHDGFSDSIIIGLQPKGVFLAERISKKLEELLGKYIPTGQLDISFNRDDFRRREIPVKSYITNIPFQIEGKKVILVDDVLYTGRSVRSALEALVSLGRPSKIEFLTLVDRKHSRHVPIEADYIGQKVNTLPTQKVLVELKEQGFENDNIWLITNDE
ncbi:MAG: bifunctional pyr operon transcriptional regulator/uracil phosphoribosyltransferase PyrR [Opitutaceae bacterium]|nr:bifunctional pyr operon transcriptional regulator/uracil phosphoribosyltransferase PyrR [Cytophagales bacterium]